MDNSTLKLPFKIGDTCSFSKTLTETDVYLFAGITGDFSKMHTNEAFMKKTRYKTRMVHGVLTFAVGVTASTLIQEQARSPMPSVSYGFDKLRFIRPVFLGETVTGVYTIDELDEVNLKSFAKLEVYNERGEICVAARHILKFFPLENQE